MRRIPAGRGPVTDRAGHVLDSRTTARTYRGAVVALSEMSERASVFSSTSGVPIGSEMTCPVAVESPRCSALRWRNCCLAGHIGM